MADIAFETLAGSDGADRALREVEIVDNVWIEMSDGVHLAAKIWRPVGAGPIPAVLEFIPYRKSDVTAIRDHCLHSWMAARGYACVRADMRGHGDSEGLMEDEYLPREQLDAVEIIEWLAAQGWCSGSVGMMGLSWGGITSLQAAVKQPPALKAIIAVGASVDRYYDDGGYLVGGYPGQGLGWGGTMFGHCIRPPDPAVVGARWRKMWLERIDATPMFAEKWLRHQLRDETWIQGSVCEGYERIKVPVLGVSGWNDCWPNTVIRLLENVSAPCRVVSGAWGHVYPNLGGPGPRYGFLQAAKQWWDLWLRGEDAGALEEPAFTGYLMRSHPPDANASDRPGRWIGESVWPSPNIETVRLRLSPGKLGAAGSLDTITIYSPLSTGLCTGEYMPMSGAAELPQDQRTDDAKSMCFDTEPLAESMAILGTTTLALRVACDQPEGLIAARLCDVAPDGRSTLISFGILNLALRDGRERLAPIVPGAPMDVTVRLNDMGYEIVPGHRLRLAVSTNLWPMAWPLASTPSVALDLSESELAMPIRRGGDDRAPSSSAFPPEAAPPPPHEMVRPASGSREVIHDVASGTVTYDVRSDAGETRFKDTGLTFGSTSAQRYSLRDADPLSPRIEYRSGFTARRGDWNVRTETELIATCTATDFELNGRVSAFEGGETIKTREWHVTVPRIGY